MLERMTWFRQSALRWADCERAIYIDPWGTPEDSPPADLIMITHAHDDHLRPEEIDRLRTSATTVVAPTDVAQSLSGDVLAVSPGESHEAGGVRFSTVPAWCLEAKVAAAVRPRRRSTRAAVSARSRPITGTSNTVISTSAGSRPAASPCARKISILRFNVLRSDGTLQPSASRAAICNVRRSPEPPTMMGTRPVGRG